MQTMQAASLIIGPARGDHTCTVTARFERAVFPAVHVVRLLEMYEVGWRSLYLLQLHTTHAARTVEATATALLLASRTNHWCVQGSSVISFFQHLKHSGVISG